MNPAEQYEKSNLAMHEYGQVRTGPTVPPPLPRPRRRPPLIVNQADRLVLSYLPGTFRQYLLSCLPKFIAQFSVYKDELVIYCAPSGVLPIAHFLRDHNQAYYKSVMDITAVDFPERNMRFDVSTINDRLRSV